MFLVGVANGVEGCGFAVWIFDFAFDWVLEEGFDGSGSASEAGVHEYTFSVFVADVVDIC